MAKRFRDTELWDKDWFMSLSPKHKLLIQFLFDKCDAAGVWSINWMLASAYIGEPITRVDLDPLKKHIQILDDKRVFLTDFINFQYGELSENCAPHKKILSLLKKHGIKKDVSKGIYKGTVRVSNTLKEEDKEEEEGKVKEEEEEKVILPFESENFKTMWQHWKDYKKAEHKFNFKSIQSEQAGLNELVKLSDGHENIAIEIIKQSMAKGWKGLFELKDNANGQTTIKAGTGKELNADYKRFVAAKLGASQSNGTNEPYSSDKP